jgi:hypothetical protein
MKESGKSALWRFIVTMAPPPCRMAPPPFFPVPSYPLPHFCLISSARVYEKSAAEQNSHICSAVLVMTYKSTLFVLPPGIEPGSKV